MGDHVIAVSDPGVILMRNTDTTRAFFKEVRLLTDNPEAMELVRSTAEHMIENLYCCDHRIVTLTTGRSAVVLLGSIAAAMAIPQIIEGNKCCDIFPSFASAGCPCHVQPS